jgi:hypothetical protein
MKKLLILWNIFCICTVIHAQTVNENFPVGQYKLVIDEVNCYLHIAENNRLAFKLNGAFSDDNNSDLYDTITVLMPGNYTRKDSSRIAVHLDPSPNNYIVEAKHSKDIKRGKIRIRIENFACIDQDQILLAKKFDPDSKSLSVSDFTSGNNRDKNYLITEKFDSLYITMVFPFRSVREVSSYHLPSDMNDIIIKSTQSQRYRYPDTFNLKRGENDNEIIMSNDPDNEDGFTNELHFFFLRHAPDTLLMNSSFSPRDEYSFLTPANQFSYEQIDDEPESDAELKPTIVFAPPIITEDEPISNQRYPSYSDALDAAQYGDRLLVLIYDTDKDAEDYETNPFGIPNVPDNYDYALNQRFITYFLGEKDKLVLQRYNIKRSPGIIILSNNERLIYSSQGKSIYDALKLTFGSNVSDPEKLYDALKEYHF